MKANKNGLFTRKAEFVTRAANLIGRAAAFDFAWLCSEAASFVVGHTLIVDGGQTVP